VFLETGNYLALDLGGTNFRVLLIALKGKTVDMQNKIYPISEELMLGEGTKVCNLYCYCIVFHVQYDGDIFCRFSNAADFTPAQFSQ